jgi:hypothetical protein
VIVYRSVVSLSSVGRGESSTETKKKYQAAKACGSKPLARPQLQSSSECARKAKQTSLISPPGLKPKKQKAARPPARSPNQE